MKYTETELQECRRKIYIGLQKGAQNKRCYKLHKYSNPSCTPELETIFQLGMTKQTQFRSCNEFAPYKNKGQPNMP